MFRIATTSSDAGYWLYWLHKSRIQVQPMGRHLWLAYFTNESQFGRWVLLFVIKYCRKKRNIFQYLYFLHIWWNIFQYLYLLHVWSGFLQNGSSHLSQVFCAERQTQIKNLSFCLQSCSSSKTHIYMHKPWEKKVILALTSVDRWWIQCLSEWLSQGLVNDFTLIIIHWGFFVLFFVVFF